MENITNFFEKYAPWAKNLDAGAHPGPMGELKSPRAARLPLPTTSPSGGRVWRCTHGWLLPCLLNYCSAGPWVAAAAPPRSFFSFFIFVWLGGGGALRLVCQAQEYSPGTVGHYTKQNKNKTNTYKKTFRSAPKDSQVYVDSAYTSGHQVYAESAYTCLRGVR